MEIVCISGTRKSDNISRTKQLKQVLRYILGLGCILYLGLSQGLRSQAKYTELFQLPHVAMNLAHRHNSYVTISILGRVMGEEAGLKRI
jgi:hypothetical protein